MISALLLAAVVGSPSASLPGALAGCWAAPGQVRGRAARTIARGSWKLGGRYLLLELHGKDPKRPYDAAILFAPAKGGTVKSFWMDSWGGDYSTAGEGTSDAQRMTVDYRYPEATYVNRFVRHGAGWRWTIDEVKPGSRPTLFAEYKLSPRAACPASAFAF